MHLNNSNSVIPAKAGIQSENAPPQRGTKAKSTLNKTAGFRLAPE
jgi:hypothetical protein